MLQDLYPANLPPAMIDLNVRLGIEVMAEGQPVDFPVGHVVSLRAFLRWCDCFELGERVRTMALESLGDSGLDVLSNLNTYIRVRVGVLGVDDEFTSAVVSQRMRVEWIFTFRDSHLGDLVATMAWNAIDPGFTRT